VDKETEWAELLESLHRLETEEDLVFEAECSEYIYLWEDMLARHPGNTGFEGQRYVKPHPPIKRTRRMLELYQKDARKRVDDWLSAHGGTFF
jgi:hypothetical protein